MSEITEDAYYISHYDLCVCWDKTPHDGHEKLLCMFDRIDWLHFPFDDCDQVYLHITRKSIKVCYHDILLRELEFTLGTHRIKCFFEKEDIYVKDEIYYKLLTASCILRKDNEGLRQISEKLRLYEGDEKWKRKR